MSRFIKLKKTLRVLPPEPLDKRIADGLARFVDAGRVAAWHEAAAHKLSSTQAQVISELARNPLRLSDVAQALGVSTATTSDAVRVLVQKGLVEKGKDLSDGRAVRLDLTAEGRKLAPFSESWRQVFVDAQSTLSERDREDLLQHVVKILHALQEQKAIAVARTCLTCLHFHPRGDPRAVPKTGEPAVRDQHYCDAYEAEYGDPEIKTNCPEHDPK